MDIVAFAEDWPELLVIHDGILFASFFEVIHLQLLILQAEEKGLALWVLDVGDVLVLCPGAGRESSEDVVGGGERKKDCIALACAHLMEGAGFELVLGPSEY